MPEGIASTEYMGDLKPKAEFQHRDSVEDLVSEASVELGERDAIRESRAADILISAKLQWCVTRLRRFEQSSERVSVSGEPVVPQVVQSFSSRAGIAAVQALRFQVRDLLTYRQEGLLVGLHHPTLSTRKKTGPYQLSESEEGPVCMKPKYTQVRAFSTSVRGSVDNSQLDRGGG